jgi:1,4-dihydroxy-2-naphthoyl-CoA hydrolase
MTSEIPNPYADGNIPRSPAAVYLGIEPLEVDETQAVARVVLEDHHKQPRGAVHAGILLALADNTATIMANRANGVGGSLPGFMVTVDLHAVLLANVTEGEIRAIAKVVRRGRRVTVIRTEVVGPDGRVLTEVTSTHIPN